MLVEKTEEVDSDNERSFAFFCLNRDKFATFLRFVLPDSRVGAFGPVSMHSCTKMCYNICMEFLYRHEIRQLLRGTSGPFPVWGMESGEGPVIAEAPRGFLEEAADYGDLRAELGADGVKFRLLVPLCEITYRGGAYRFPVAEANRTTVRQKVGDGCYVIAHKRVNGC